MADHRKVIAGADRQFHILAPTVTLGDGTHVEVVGHHEVAVEAELIAQETPDDFGRERCGKIGIDVGKLDVREHD